MSVALAYLALRLLLLQPLLVLLTFLLSVHLLTV